MVRLQMLQPRGAFRHGARMSETQPGAGWFEGRVHHLPVRIYYEDTDFSGVVYHANYLHYFERGRSDFLRLAGIHHRELAEGDDPTAFAVHRMEIDFLKAARIDDGLVVRSAWDSMQGPRMFISQAVWRGTEEICRARVTACCISMTGRAKRPPRLLSEKLTRYLEG